MNKLEKFFNTLHSTQSKVLKKFTTEELVSQIKEYVDFTPFICKNIYKLLISQNSEDRKNGAAILKSIMFQFRLITDFKIEYTKNKEEYLCSTGEEFIVKQISIREQAKLVKKMAELEHVEVSLVNEIDFKADTSFKIKKQKIKDKPIENIMDFFDNITANLLNFEWNKRHGAFLAFTSMFSESYDGDTEIKVDSSVFMKIYEILKNDKFNDFVDDKTTAPVREAAAELLACIYPRIPKNTIIDELFKFLEDEDWQTQYSGLIALNHLRDFIIKKEDLCLILEKMLIDTDEDVKYLSAQILKHFIKFCNLKEVASKCWDNIRNEEEIAVSKTSIISLLAEIHNINPTIIKIEDNINYLFPCFTSPIPEVRKSVLEMVKEINNESINFLIAETILLDENEEIRELAINILSKINNLGPNFINLFMKILSNSLYEPYSTDDFVSYDELAFTKSGVKLIGEDKILKNRVKLFMAIQKNLIKVENKSNTAIGKIFYLINEYFSKSNQDVSDLEENGSIKNKDLQVDNTKVDKVKRQKIQEDEDFLYKSFSDLRLVPLKELKSKIQNPFKSGIHPMGDPIFRDYLRLKTILDFPILDLNTSLLFRFETCDEFLRLLSTLIIHKNPTNFIFEAFTLLVEGVDNFKIFFEVLGCRLLFDYPNVLSKINNSSSKIDFYSKTISFYSSEFDQLENLFYESYDKKAIRVLKGFIQNLKYAEKFVDLILKNFDLFLLSELIGDLDHSFYPLFVKKLLKIMHNNDQDVLSPSKILSFIVPRLSFNLNQNLNPIWLNRIEEAKNSLEALLDINKIPEYKSKCPTELILRNYQIEGVKWINFLFSFHLNGILADDMGLGKTIQVLYFICSEIYKTNKKVLILCPSSLTGHWKGEIEKFYPFIKCKIYKKRKNGNEKNGNNGKKDNEINGKNDNGKNQIETNNEKDYETTNEEGYKNNDFTDQILISSYDMFRNDYLNFIDKNWFYIILDEGHILRNSNTRLYNRVCQLKPTNKLVLTGTPVHNSVEDLISIFNFIMPKYLESSENIQISLKMSDQEVEKTYARLADLNKKILPFILRRLKIDVLKDLPPKIIRDITIEMGPIQQEVYNEINHEINNNNDNNNDFINYKNIKNNAEGLKRTRDLLYASSHTSHFKKSYNEIPCKVKALEDIINLCGGEDIRNKILIFFQYKNTLEFVLEDIKSKFKMKILRLDGSVPSSKRSKIAQDFNEGNIPLLFLTTQIGGLGLNLTGADTVVFYEHDWNPFNDLQAMDRAHRIGQKKTVNVFRLITKGTLEERVMDLQSFKLFVASSLVSQQNADIETMDTKDLLERFS